MHGLKIAVSANSKKRYGIGIIVVNSVPFWPKLTGMFWIWSWVEWDALPKGSTYNSGQLRPFRTNLAETGSSSHSSRKRPFIIIITIF